MIKDVTVSDEDIQKYYDENKAQQYDKKPGATISHILVGKEDADKQKAEQAKEELKKGAKFEELAAKYGTDGTKTTGGSLGYIEYDTTKYDADFMAAAKKLKEGEVSDVIKTQFGYHLIKVTGVHDKDYTIPLSDVKDKIKESLGNGKKQEVYTKTLEEWKKDLKVEIYEDKLK